MSYKEGLYFIAACLTISFENKNRLKVEKLLKSNSIDWDNLVKISTSHYVFPALYCNLKREGFLHYLPEDLVNYMKHITTLNRKRNLQIIYQAKELNNLLLLNKVTPIFLKGTGNLLAGLYNDVAERMIGDIDFIFSKQDYPKAINILRDNGYYNVGRYDFDFPEQRHYVRLKKNKRIAAVEIHKGLLIEKYSNEFNYNIVKESMQVINGISVLSYSNKLNLSIIASQINDKRSYYKTIALRNAYDVFLLSKKTNAKDAINTLKKLNQPLNFFLATCFEVFNKISSLDYNKTKKTTLHLTSFNLQFTNIKKTKRNHNLITIFIFLKTRINIIYKSVLYIEYRNWLFKRVLGKSWYKEKLKQLGIK